MAINRNKPSNLPSAREIRKQKEKWMDKPNDKDIRQDYFSMLYVAGKIEELEKILLEVLEKEKGKRSFSTWGFVTAQNIYEKISLDLTIKLVDNHLIVRKDTLSKDIDFNRYKPKFASIVKDRIKVLGLDNQTEPINTKEPEETPTMSTEEALIGLSTDKNQKVVEQLYKTFKQNFKEEWKINRDMVKALFRIARNMRKYNEEQAQELLDFCISAFPDNGNFIRINNKWNPKVVEEGEIEEDAIEMVKDDVIVEIVPLEKQIYNQDEIFGMEPKLKDLFEPNSLNKIIESDTTKFRKDRKWGSILISLASIVLNTLNAPDNALLIYNIIEEMTFKSELRAKEIKNANLLKYDILVAQCKYDEAEEWSEENDLDVQLEIPTEQKTEINEVIAKQESADNIFYEVVREEAIKFYRKRVDFYINNGQFKHKLGEEVSDVIINNIKNKIAVDLKYLDFEIRELLIPYFIKIESSAKVITKTYKNVIGSVIDKAFGNYTDDMKFILDTSKINSAFTNQEIFQQFILAFRVIRNHMVHGNLNLFGLKLYESRESKIESFDYEDAISLYEDSGDASLDAILLNAKRKSTSVDLFRLSIAEKVLSYDAIENRRMFGIAILILFITTPQYTFLRIASEIDHKINTFKNRTVLGSKNKLYESLGLKPDWLIQLSKLEE